MYLTHIYCSISSSQYVVSSVQCCGKVARSSCLLISDASICVINLVPILGVSSINHYTLKTYKHIYILICSNSSVIFDVLIRCHVAWWWSMSGVRFATTTKTQFYATFSMDSKVFIESRDRSSHNLPNINWWILVALMPRHRNIHTTRQQQAWRTHSSSVSTVDSICVRHMVFEWKRSESNGKIFEMRMRRLQAFLGSITFPLAIRSIEKKPYHTAPATHIMYFIIYPDSTCCYSK